MEKLALVRSLKMDKTLWGAVSGAVGQSKLGYSGRLEIRPLEADPKIPLNQKRTPQDFS